MLIHMWISCNSVDCVNIVALHCYDPNPNNKQLQGGLTLAHGLMGSNLLWQGSVVADVLSC